MHLLAQRIVLMEMGDILLFILSDKEKWGWSRHKIQIVYSSLVINDTSSLLL